MSTSTPTTWVLLLCSDAAVPIYFAGCVGGCQRTKREKLVVMKRRNIKQATSRGRSMPACGSKGATPLLRLRLRLGLYSRSTLRIPMPEEKEHKFSSGW